MDPDSVLARARRLYDAAWAWCRWKGPTRVAASCAIGVLLVCAGWLLIRSPAPTIESQIPRVATSTDQGSDSRVATSTTSTIPLVVVVHVAGAVRHPGVVFLPGGSRANDALIAAGGFAASADTSAVNLAMVVHDGDQFYVPTRTRSRSLTPPPQRVTRQPSSGGARTGTGGGDPSTSSRVDINTATVGELDALPGIGPSTAQAIVEWRDTHGPFATVDSLLDVRGIGDAKLDAIRDRIRV